MAVHVNTTEMSKTKVAVNSYLFARSGQPYTGILTGTKMA